MTTIDKNNANGAYNSDSNNLDNAPNTSPQSPQATFVGRLLAMQQSGYYEIKNAEKICEEAFSLWSNFSDEDLFQGRVENKNPEMDIYAIASNILFPMAHGDSGAIIQLNPTVVEFIAPKAYLKLAAIGGAPFISTMCDAVNEEVQARLPDRNPTVAVAEQAFPSNSIDKTPPTAPAA